MSRLEVNIEYIEQYTDCGKSQMIKLFPEI